MCSVHDYMGRVSLGHNGLHLVGIVKSGVAALCCCVHQQSIIENLRQITYLYLFDNTCLMASYCIGLSMSNHPQFIVFFRLGLGFNPIFHHQFELLAACHRGQTSCAHEYCRFVKTGWLVAYDYMGKCQLGQPGSQLVRAGILADQAGPVFM